MCLAVPGRVESILPEAGGMTMGRVSFGGITSEVCLAWLPDVRVGDYVVVHVGFAIGRVDEREAQETFRLLERAGELDGLKPAEDEG